MRRRWQGWLLWFAVVFGLFNAGLRHHEQVSIEAGLEAGKWPGLVTAVRAYITNDGDIRRYFAYAEAALGRPYQSYFVRSAETWRQEFAVHERYRPDDLPTIAPPRPLVPYRDYLVEYPPGFFLVSLPPAFIAHNVDTYKVLFQSLMGAALTGALILMTMASRTLGRPSDRGSTMAWGALSVLLLGVVATHRADAAVALAVTAAAWALARRRPAVIGLALGVAVALKVTPLVVVPIFLMHAASERRLRDLGIAATAGAAAVAILCLPAIVNAGPRLLETLRYHADRPIQIESTWGAILGLIHAAVPTWVTVEETFGSINLVGPFTRVATLLSNITTLAGLGGVYVVTWRRLRVPLPAQRALAALEATIAAFVVFMGFGKVCSPQYLVWLLPLGLALCLGRERRVCLILFLMLLALTQVIYPAIYGFLTHLRPGACLLVLVRNLLLLTWAALLLRAPHGVAADGAERREGARRESAPEHAGRS